MNIALEMPQTKKSGSLESGLAVCESKEEVGCIKCRKKATDHFVCKDVQIHLKICTDQQTHHICRVYFRIRAKHHASV